MRALSELTLVILVLFLFYTAVGMSDFAHQFLNVTINSLFSLFFPMFLGNSVSLSKWIKLTSSAGSRPRDKGRGSRGGGGVVDSKKTFLVPRLPPLDPPLTSVPRNIKVSFNSSAEADVEEDVTFKILKKDVHISRFELLKRLERANLTRYGYKKEISTSKRIGSNKSEHKVSRPTVFLTPYRVLCVEKFFLAAMNSNQVQFC